MRVSTSRSSRVNGVIAISIVLGMAVTSGCAAPAERVHPPAAPQREPGAEMARRQVERDREEIEGERERREAIIRVEPLLHSATPPPAAFHTDRPVYTVSPDSPVIMTLTYVNRMADTAYLHPFRFYPSTLPEPRYWILQRWTGERWRTAYSRLTVDGEGIPPIRVPPRGTLTHTLRVPAEALRSGLLATRPAPARPPDMDEERSGTYRMYYQVYRGWMGIPGIDRPEAPLAESVSNTFEVRLRSPVDSVTSPAALYPAFHSP